MSGIFHWLCSSTESNTLKNNANYFGTPDALDNAEEIDGFITIT
jgi:hypothetical protein